MKTSNKLLLSFVGLIVLLMLLADTVIWANYKRGKSGDGALTPDEHYANVKEQPVKAFKVLKIDGNVNLKLFVIKAEKYGISHFGDTARLLYSVQNDTMFINMRDGGSFTLECHDLHTVILSKNVGVTLSGFEQPSLNIIADNSCEIQLSELKIGVLDVKGGEENEFVAEGAASKIDSIHLQLGRSSVLRSFDVSYGHVSMNIDNLKDLQLTGASLSSMKQIK